MEILVEFRMLVAALGGMALLMLIQILVADVLGIRSKHIPGAPVYVDHDSLFFRAVRTVANTNESIAVFILAVLFCVLAEAPPLYTAYAAWGFVVSRILYAVCYYSNLKLLRSAVFGISLLFVFALLIIGTT